MVTIRGVDLSLHQRDDGDFDAPLGVFLVSAIEEASFAAALRGADVKVWFNGRRYGVRPCPATLLERLIREAGEAQENVMERAAREVDSLEREQKRLGTLLAILAP